jgi:hypothetical protein
MTPIRKKDQIFLAVAVPAALILVYVCFVRPDWTKKRQAWAARDRALVTEEAYPQEERSSRRMLEEAETACAREKAKPMPVKDVEGCAAASPAQRTQAVMAVFRAAGVCVTSSTVETQSAQNDEAAAALRATGLCPQPVVRTYRFEADYGALRAALAAFAERKMAVVIPAVACEGDGKWSVRIYE